MSVLILLETCEKEERIGDKTKGRILLVCSNQCKK